jgi:hypothetical protein
MSLRLTGLVGLRLAATLGDDDLRTRRPGYFRALASYCTTAFGAVRS